jgi:hypothetical protein
VIQTLRIVGTKLSLSKFQQRLGKEAHEEACEGQAEGRLGSTRRPEAMLWWEEHHFTLGRRRRSRRGFRIRARTIIGGQAR